MNIDPITIILFLIFFVAPIVNNFLRRGQGQQGRQEQTGRRPQQRPNQQPQRQERPGNTTTADTSRDGSMGDDFRGRLEEARRRVQEAMSSGSSEDSSSPAQPPSSERSGSDLFPRLDDEKQTRSQQTRSQQGRSQRPPGGSQRSSQGSQQGQRGARPAFGDLGREGVSRQRPSSQQGTQSQQGAVGTDLGDAPPLRVQRLRPRKGSKIGEQRGVLEFDRRSVMQGIIWREILDEPLSKRKRRKRH